MTDDDVLQCLIEECHDDHVGLWRIVNSARFDLAASDPLETRALTLHLVRSLLRERDIRIGHPAPDGRQFIVWDLSPELAVRRIEEEWSALGRDPNMGDIAWFTSVP